MYFRAIDLPLPLNTARPSHNLCDPIPIHRFKMAEFTNPRALSGQGPEFTNRRRSTRKRASLLSEGVC